STPSAWRRYGCWRGRRRRCRSTSCGGRTGTGRTGAGIARSNNQRSVATGGPPVALARATGGPPVATDQTTPRQREGVSMTKRFDYGCGTIRDLGVCRTAEGSNPGKANDVLIQGQPVRSTPRFWTSLQVRFGFSGNIFKFFTHEEVFQRISEKAGN